MLDVTEVRRLIRRLDHRRLHHEVVTQQQSMGVLRNLPEESTLYITTLTEPTNLHKGLDCKVLKRSEVLVKASYEQFVNERREKERKLPDFEALERRWGVGIDSPFIAHRLKSGEWRVYLAGIVVNTSGSEYLTPDLTPLPFEVVRPWIKPKRPASAAQGLKKEVAYRNWDLDHILAIQVSRGPSYIIGDPKAAATRPRRIVV